MPQLHIGISEVRAFGVFGNSMQNPPASWQEGFAHNRPFGWGNASVLSEFTQAMYATNPQAMFFIVPGLNPFYVPSGCAWVKWARLQNQELCLAVQP